MVYCDRYLLDRLPVGNWYVNVEPENDDYGWGACSSVYARMLYYLDGAKFTYFIRMNKATFDFPYVLEKMEQYFITQLRYETAFGDASVGETILKLATTSRTLATREFQKHSFISSAFRLPKMHCATQNKHGMKETPLIGLTYWESYSIIQQISPNSHWWFLADFSSISRMIWEIIASYDFSDHIRNRRCSWSHMISRRFLAEKSYDSRRSRFSPPSVISRRFLCEKSPVWIRH